MWYLSTSIISVYNGQIERILLLLLMLLLLILLLLGAVTWLLLTSNQIVELWECDNNLICCFWGFCLHSHKFLPRQHFLFSLIWTCMKTHPVICPLSVSGSAFDLLTSPERYISCSLSCSWVFIHEKAYQTSDTGIESSVMTKVKGFGYHHNQVMDVADYVFPSQVGNTRGDYLFCFWLWIIRS